jgi:hypothetical protein
MQLLGPLLCALQAPKRKDILHRHQCHFFFTPEKKKVQALSIPLVSSIEERRCDNINKQTNKSELKTQKRPVRFVYKYGDKLIIETPDVTRFG